MKQIADRIPKTPLTDLAALIARTHSTPKVVPMKVKIESHVIGAFTNVITWAPKLKKNK